MVYRLGDTGAAAGRPRRPTINDVARIANVSKGAASRALNGRPGVAQATRERVEQAAEDLGWVANPMARALSGARADAIGWVILRSAKAHAVDPYFMALFAGIQLGLAASPSPLVVKLVESLEEEIETYRVWSAEYRVDAVLVMDLREDDPRAAVLTELQLPVVAFVAQRDRHEGFAVVWNDEAALTTTLLDEAYVRGHRRIGWIAGAENLETTQTRLSAARDWATGRDATVSFCFSDLDGESGACATEDLIDGAGGPTLICVDNDRVAMAVIGRLRRLGRRVPEDVSVVCWVDSELCELTSPSITALRHDIEGYGAELGRRLLALVETGEVGGPTQVAMPELIVRESLSTIDLETSSRENK